jgi:hypothetical protein
VAAGRFIPRAAPVPAAIDGAPAVSAAQKSGHAATTSIAVLPFANLTGDPGQEIVADGLAGFVAHTRRELFRQLQPLRTDACPFHDLPNSRSDRWGGGVTADEMREIVGEARGSGAGEVRGVDRGGPAAARGVRRRTTGQGGERGAARVVTTASPARSAPG